jgi:hypothetical protein
MRFADGKGTFASREVDGALGRIRPWALRRLVEREGDLVVRSP